MPPLLVAGISAPTEQSSYTGIGSLGALGVQGELAADIGMNMGENVMERTPLKTMVKPSLTFRKIVKIYSISIV